MKVAPRSALVLVVLAVWAQVAWAQTVWVEGENPATSDVRPHPWWYDKVDASQLSAGKQLSNWGEEEGTALYRIAIPETGKYDFYIRANPARSGLVFRIGLGKWRRIDFSHAVDRTNIADDGANDLRYLAWVKAGTFELEKGKITLQMRMNSENNNHGYIDALVFTSDKKIPKGTKMVEGKWSKPAAAVEVKKTGPKRNTDAMITPRAHTVGQAGTWAFEPGPDAFTDDAMLDLRSLNEERSGMHGFCKLSQDAERIVRGDGKVMRFWASLGGLDHRRRGRDGTSVRHTAEQIASHWRFLAKKGVNLVRLHKTIAPTWDGAKIDEIDQVAIDNIWRSIKGAKDNGIYIVLSPLYAHFKVPASWDLEGYEAGKDMPWHALMVDEKFKAAYKKWIKALYTRKNPHTGLAIKDDPTVAVIQVHNEDGLLFWTLNALPEAQLRTLSKHFGDWLSRKYGSLEQARDAWGGAEEKTDNFEAGMASLMMPAPMWQMTQEFEGPKAERMRDQIEFIARYQRDFYREMDDYIKNDLGCKQLTNAGNWYTADDSRLMALERWSYMPMDVIAKNNYCGAGVHVGSNRGYRIDPGHHIKNESALFNPAYLPTSVKQVAGMPFLVTESTWVNPNLYQAEGPFLVAAYQSLSGLDALHWFATNQPTWQEDPRRTFWPVVRGNDRGYAIGKWSCSTAPLVGMFPANAVTYRLGYLEEGEPVVHEHRSLEAMFNRRPGLIGEDKGFDPNVETKEVGAAADRVSKLAYLVGPVKVTYDSEPRKTELTNLSPYIDAEKGVVSSNTGQIQLNWAKGVATISSPKSQGVAGFLASAGGKFTFPAVTIESENDYATVQLVSLDDKALIASDKILVQVGTWARLTGWSTKPATFKDGDKTVNGEEILLTGKPPYRVANTRVKLVVTNSRITTATVLDPNGYRLYDIPAEREYAKVSIDLPANAMYVILH